MAATGLVLRWLVRVAVHRQNIDIDGAQGCGPAPQLTDRASSFFSLSGDLTDDLDLLIGYLAFSFSFHGDRAVSTSFPPLRIMISDVPYVMNAVRFRILLELLGKFTQV